MDYTNSTRVTSVTQAPNGDVTSTSDEQMEGDLDQAFISYDTMGVTVSVGGMDSQLGFEAFEAPGLYTNTFAYGDSQLPGTDLGIKVTKQLDAVSSLGIAFLDEGSFLGDESAAGDTTIEVAYGRDLGNGLGAFVGLRSEANGDDLMNAYVTYETGAFTFAAEIVDGENDTDLHFLQLCNELLPKRCLRMRSWQEADSQLLFHHQQFQQRTCRHLFHR